jgi:hypothetical protein
MAADVYNCADFDWQDEAQAEFDKDTTDPNRLDDDNDSEACETLPRRAVAAPAAAATSGTTTASQVSTVPSGAIAAGDGSSSGEAGVLPYAVGGVALIGAAGAAAAARRARSAA